MLSPYILLLPHMKCLVSAAANLTSAPVLISLMMHRLFSLPSWSDEPRSWAVSCEAHELLELLPPGIRDRPREFSRSLQSAARLHVKLPAPVLAEAHAALATGLKGYSLRDVEAVITAIAKLFPGSSEFDAGIDVVAARLLHQDASTSKMTVRFQVTVLWALARIGYQSSTVSSLVETFARSFMTEVR